MLNEPVYSTAGPAPHHVIHDVANIGGRFLVHHVVVLVHVQYVRRGRDTSDMKLPLPSSKRVAVPFDDEINRTSPPSQEIFQGTDGILCKIEIVEIDVQDRAHQSWSFPE